MLTINDGDIMLTIKELSLKQKVFGIGLSRTGTTSLTQALNLLGYKAFHFPADKVTQSEFYDFFASRPEFINLSILKDYDALTDTPVCCLYKALDKSYPGSKFVLTVRDKKTWLRSCERLWKDGLDFNLHQQPDDPVNQYILFIHERLYGTPHYEPETFSRIYDTYITEVVEYFRDRPQDFLILDICSGEGWSKLAPFLGAATPMTPFPWEAGRWPLEEPVPAPFIEEVTPSCPGHYGGRLTSEQRAQWIQGFSPGLRNNPNYQPQANVDIPWYLQQQQQNPEYRQQLENLDRQQVPLMHKDCEMAICLAVAGHQEQDNIYRTLQTYEVQTDKDGKSVWDSNKYEVLLLVNWPKGADPSKTFEEIERFKRDYKQKTGKDFPLTIYHYEVPLQDTPEGPRPREELGLWKKMIFDEALIRSNRVALDKDITLVMNDADMIFTNPRYLEGMLTLMHNPQYQQFDAILGRQVLEPEKYAEYPTFHAAMCYWGFMDSIFRAKLGSSYTQGRNTVIRGSSYAAIGGNRRKDFGADLEFGNLLNLARKNKPSILYSNANWVMVDPRREVSKFEAGESLAYTWSDFNTRKVRGERQNPGQPQDVDIELLQNDTTTIQKFETRLTGEINALLNVFAYDSNLRNIESIRDAYIESLGLSLDASVEYVLKRSLDFLGIDADIAEYQNANDQRRFGIHIKDSTKLRQKLKAYHVSEGRFIKLKGNPLLFNAEHDKYLIVLGKRINALRKGTEYIKGDLKQTPEKQQQHMNTLLRTYRKYAGRDYDASPSL